MKNITLFILFFIFASPFFSQINFTANDQVAKYNEAFRVGVNPGYNGSNWKDKNLAVLAAGSSILGVPGVGMKNFRVSLPEAFLDQWGYNVRIDEFKYYDTLGMGKHTVFLEGPTSEHQSQDSYCSGSQSQLWKNMYLPIWDDGENGTPVNDDNYAALYVYRTVSKYKNYVKFWEIFNEPDFDYSNTGWREPGEPGNWWENVPDPCDYKLQAPVYEYIRLLRISYEVIKSIDPDAFVGVGGLGYESFLDIILRYSDNPVNGEITSEYPLTGGAYFDAMIYHCYPHINGSMRYWSSTLNQHVNTRHSDAGANGVIALKNSFENVLNNYGYNGNTFPKKTFILTETNIPRIQFDDDIGSDEAQRNFAIKVQVQAIKNDIKQLHFFELAEKETPQDAQSWTKVSGLYEKISDDTPYDVTRTQEGIACETTTHFLWEKEYDQIATTALNLPNNIKGGAFKSSTGKTVFVLWAETETDMSETASATYSFPSTFNFESVDIHSWNYKITNNATNTTPTNIELTGSPIFITESESPNSSQKSLYSFNFKVYPNPASDVIYLEFENKTVTNGTIILKDASGREIYNSGLQLFNLGKQRVEIPTNKLRRGVYLGEVSFNNETRHSFQIIK